jgi:hypothetical protein
MDMPLKIVLAAAVLMGVGAIILIGFSGEIGELDSTTDSIEDQGCEYQRERTDDPEQLSPECREEGTLSQIESSAQEALEQLNSDN